MLDQAEKDNICGRSFLILLFCGKHWCGYLWSIPAMVFLRKHCSESYFVITVTNLYVFQL
jgi:hypothetical protein